LVEDPNQEVGGEITCDQTGHGPGKKEPRPRASWLIAPDANQYGRRAGGPNGGQMNTCWLGSAKFATARSAIQAR
jgi:hypothetical protein